MERKDTISVKMQTKPSEFTELTYLVSKILQQGHSFSLWRLPGESQKQLLSCQRGMAIEGQSLDELEKGFVMTPFPGQGTSMFFPAEELMTIPSGDSVSSESVASLGLHYTASAPNTARDYKAIVTDAIQNINAGEFEKVVPARCQDVNLPVGFNAVEAFLKLTKQYPNAFVSLVSSPQTGTWLTASPELLVETTAEGIFRTVALAGTQALLGRSEKDIAWTQKEIEEQAMVTRYIINCFKQVRVREYEEHGPKTISVGEVAHLKTDFTVNTSAIKFPSFGAAMLGLLHPTSAVCGMPKEPALSYLQQNEGFDRSYYSGYLGPVNINTATNLYVNLRCAQLYENSMRVYAGAGVTADSDPAKEKEEIDIKMQALLSVLQ